MHDCVDLVGIQLRQIGSRSEVAADRGIRALRLTAGKCHHLVGATQLTDEPGADESRRSGNQNPCHVSEG
jgi:hypothetical protein